MTRTFLFCAASLVIACGSTTKTSTVGTQTNPEDPGPGSAKEPEPHPAPDVPAKWTWSAGIVTAWRLDGGIHDILALDDKRGIAVGGVRLHLIALDSGAVTEHGTFDKGVPTALVRAGGRVLAFGNTGKQSAAWSVDPESLAIAPLELPEAAAGVATKGRFAIAVSPDGKRVLTCGDDRWPTVRDATTLAPVATFTAAESCSNPRFVDDKRVALDRSVDSRTGGRIGEIATGKVTTVKSGTATPLPGPGGRSALVESRQVTLSAGGKEVARYAPAAFTGATWLADGSAIVSWTRGALTVLAAKAGQKERTVEMPAAFRRATPVPGTTKLFFQSGPHRLGVIDVADGKVVSAEGTNLSDVVKIAVEGGTVVSGAERLRVWRDEKITAGGPLGVAEAIDLDAGKPALYATLHGVFTLDVVSGAADAIDSEASSTAADRSGERVLFDADEYVKTGQGAVWFKRSDDFFITDLDAATGRVAMTDDDAFYVATPDEDELFAFHAFDCEDPLYLYLERGKARAAAYDGVTVHLYDADKKKALGGIELTDDNTEALAFIPGSDEVALVGEAIYIWNPATKSLTSWQLPAAHAGIGATSIAVDATGKEVAVGFADGAVLWANLDGVRAHSAAAGADVATFKPPAGLTCKGKKMVKTLAEVRGPEDGDDSGEGYDA